MIKDFEPVVDKIRQHLKNYILKNKLQSLVIGVSGGIDSALCAVLAFDICNELDIPLLGRSITIETNKAEEISRAAAIGRYFTSDFKEVDLTQGFLVFANMLSTFEGIENPADYSVKIRRGNMKARTRMVYLYDLAAKHRGMVLSTDNYTELLLGFWTLHGDVGDYGMIQNLWKTEVYGMARFLADTMSPGPQKALLDCVEAVATDGLGITNSDLDQIQAKTYEEVDQILLKLFDKNGVGQYANHPVIKRNIASEFKRNNPYNIPRQEITDIDYTGTSVKLILI
jgi:NAD+ synthase